MPTLNLSFSKNSFNNLPIGSCDVKYKNPSIHYQLSSNSLFYKDAHYNERQGLMG